MSSRKKHDIDWIILSLYLALVSIGWAMIYTVGYGEGYTGGFFAFMKTGVGRQLIWVGISFAVLFLSYTVEAKFWRTFANFIYIGCLLLLLAVLIAGTVVNGSKSWFDFGGGISLQPSEFAKFGTALALASYLGSYANNLKTLKSKLYAIGFFTAPVLLIAIQPDAGSALVFMSFFLVLFREGFPGGILLLGFVAIAILIAGLVNPPGEITLMLAAVGALLLIWKMEKRLYGLSAFVVLATLGVIGFQHGLSVYVLLCGLTLLAALCAWFWFIKKQSLGGLVAAAVTVGALLSVLSHFAYENLLKAHQQERFIVWLKPSEADPQGAAYNLNHSKMAISSGGLFGKGFLDGNFTQGNFVPEQITDFIFCALGEEQGFVGTIIMLSLFMGLLWRIVMVAERQRSDFNRLYAYGIAGILFVHFFINIGMTMGVMPIIGIPLPFVSKGGSSLIGFTLMIGVLLKLDAARN